MGFNNSDKINKKSRFFLQLETLGFVSEYYCKEKIYGSRSENMWLSRSLEFKYMNVMQDVLYWKQTANLLTRLSGKKRSLVSTFVVRLQQLHFAYDEDFKGDGNPDDYHILYERS